jgi:hypothetical protein
VWKTFLLAQVGIIIIGMPNPKAISKSLTSFVIVLMPYSHIALLCEGKKEKGSVEVLPWNCPMNAHYL